MATIAEQKTEATEVILRHMQAVVDLAIKQGNIEGIGLMTMQLAKGLTESKTLSELKGWQDHVQQKYGHILDGSE